MVLKMIFEIIAVFTTQL